jgi:hypothetical protein
MDSFTVAGSASPSAGAMSFSNLLAGVDPYGGNSTPLATPYVPAPDDPYATTAAYDRAHMGLPDDIATYVIPPGLESSTGAVAGTPIFSSVQGAYEKVSNEVAGAITTIKGTAASVFQGVKNVGSSVVNGVSSGVKSLYWYAFLLIGLLFVGLYFVGKGGLVGQVRPA